jgi:hypothetical protein
VTLRTAHGHHKAETVEDLKSWMRDLSGCPSVDRVVSARCQRPVHGEEPGTWFYVEADAREGLARLRCIGCADMKPVLDSAERWTYPAMWSCTDCSQSIADVAYGVHADDGVVTWLVVGARCVECGSVSGLTDFVVAGAPVDEFVDSL